jgi:hypothetical protein
LLFAMTGQPGCACCSPDKFVMLKGSADQAAGMQVLASISATDPNCGNCLVSVAMAASSDPSKMMPCANSAALPMLQTMIGGGDAGSGAGAGSGPVMVADPIGAIGGAPVSCKGATGGSCPSGMYALRARSRAMLHFLFRAY